MFRIVKMRIDGRRNDREILRHQEGVVGSLNLHYQTDEKGGQIKVLQLNSSQMKQGVFEELALLYEPEFKTFNGDQFLIPGQGFREDRRRSRNRSRMVGQAGYLSKQKLA